MTEDPSHRDPSCHLDVDKATGYILVCLLVSGRSTGSVSAKTRLGISKEVCESVRTEEHGPRCIDRMVGDCRMHSRDRFDPLSMETLETTA